MTAEGFAHADPPADADPLTCSAKGCRRPAVWALHWNNPKLHPPERRKTWLACTDHRQNLADFLEVRRFLRETERVGHDRAHEPHQPGP